ncbi:MAG TPA: hypothetical protein VMN57_01865 [Anaerolineales bacterium]|nr:hypothetical protein [Anaerolineales bacterium]
MSYEVPDDRYPAESEIECVRCGEIFFYELNRCPNCGLSVYASEEEEEELEAVNQEGEPDRDSLDELMSMFAPAAAVFAGLFFSFAVATAIFIFLRGFLGDLALTWPGRAIPLLAAPLGAAVGGYTAAALEKNRPHRMGWWVGALSLIAVVVLARAGQVRETGELIAVDTALILFGTVLSGAAGSEFWRRRQLDVVVQQLFFELPEEDELYKSLMNMTGGNAETIEQLVEHERYFMPNATRRTLLESALRRLERDRG